MPLPNNAISPELLARMAREFFSVSFLEGDTEAVAALLAGLSAEMQAMRKLDVGKREPAVTYDPSVS